MSDILDCGHVARPTRIFSGYASLADGRRVCPDCADHMQREDMRTAERFSGYVSSDERTVTTWTGGELGRIVRLSRNDRQTFVRVRDSHGNMWAGIGPAETGTYTSLRRIKG